MKGTILNYDLVNGSGIISGEDGRRYIFSGTEFKGQLSANLVNRTVDFETVEGGRAEAIYLVSQAGSSAEKSKLVAGLLALFVGGLGIHKFYLGNNTAGIVMLLCSLFGIILLFIPTAVVGIIALIEAILYLTKSDEQFEETYVRNKRAWF